MTFKIFIVSFSFIFLMKYTVDWDAVYTKASYSLSHAKNALSSNNFDHQKQYSAKVLDSYQILYDHLGACD